MKKETLEEASTQYADKNHPSTDKEDPCYWYASLIGFRNGAKWQQQQMYSEEEVENILEHYDTEFKLDTFGYTKPCSFTVKEWFEQFKNK